MTTSFSARKRRGVRAAALERGRERHAAVESRSGPPSTRRASACASRLGHLGEEAELAHVDAEDRHAASAWRAIESSVPSPPRTTSRSASRASSSFGTRRRAGQRRHRRRPARGSGAARAPSRMRAGEPHRARPIALHHEADRPNAPHHRPSPALARYHATPAGARPTRCATAPFRCPGSPSCSPRARRRAAPPPARAPLAERMRPRTDRRVRRPASPARARAGCSATCSRRAASSR